MSAGVLFKIDKTTGKETTVGLTGVTTTTDWQSAAFDNKTGKMYWLAKTKDGASHMYDVDLTTGAATPVSDYEEAPTFPYFYIKAAPVDNAPADLEDMAVQFNDGSLSGLVSFTLPITTYDGSKLEGTIAYVLSDNGTMVKSGSAEAGSHVSIPVTSTEGEHIFTIVLTANGTQGNDNTKKIWVGNDQPSAVGQPSLSIGNAGLARLSWTAPTQGAHGGYVGTALTYAITDAQGDVVASNLSATSYSLQLSKDSDYAAYYYTITAFNGDKAGETANTNYQCFGKPLAAPYASVFSSVHGAMTYEMVDNNQDNITWSYDAGTQSLFYLSMYADYDQKPDDWIVTPPFQLKADRLYTFSYSARCYSESDREPLLLSIANADVEDVKDFKAVSDIDTIHTISFDPVSKTITVSKDGSYRFGIRAMENTGLAVFVRDIMLHEGAMLAAPDSVSDLIVTADAQGALKSKVAFTAPKTTISGKSLSSITKVEMFEDGATVASNTLTQVEPGKSYSMEVETSEAGTHTYRVVAYNEAGAGLAATQSAYVGEDTPLAPKNIRLVDNLDGTCKLVWDNPRSTGVHGGYVNPDHVTYEIYTVTDNTPSLYKQGVTGNCYELGAFDQENRVQKLFYYAMKAVDGSYKSDYGVSSALLSGAPYNTPVDESFANGQQKYFWATNAVVGENAFSWFTQFAADGDNGSAYFGSSSASAGDRAVLSSGKISLSGTTHPTLLFDYYYISNGAHLIKVAVKAAEGQTDTVKVIDFNQLTAQTEGWKEVSIDLSKYIDSKYITVNFDAKIGNPKALVLFDNIRVNDVYDYDLSTLLYGPSIVQTGRKASFKAVVSNIGLQPISGYSVDLYVNDEIVATQNVTNSLAAGGKDTLTFDYEVPVGATDSLTVKAVVRSDFDMDDSNDASKTISVKVARPDYPTVNDLTATNADKGVALSWSSAAGKKHTVTDRFEDYEPWAINGIGAWTLVDGDKHQTYGFDNKFPNQGTPFAYIVFNPSAVGDSDNNLDPHSGNQYMAAFSSSMGANDDWLISPELSGEAQTVTF